MTEKMRIETTRFGEIEVDKGKIIHFSAGLPGFAALKRFVLFEHDDRGQFMWLQAADDPAIAFLLTAPNLFKPDFTLPPKGVPLKSMGITDASEIVVMVMVCVSREEPQSISLNLRAPLIFNQSTMTGMQYIIDSDSYPLDFKVEIKTLEGEKGREKAV